MTVNETLIHASIEEPASEPVPYSAEWWELRTAQELRDMIKRGFGVGPAYDGAIVETERRARNTTRRLREEAAVVERKSAKARLIALAGILAIMLLLGAWNWLAG
jgi:hypothetical protein